MGFWLRVLSPAREGHAERRSVATASAASQEATTRGAGGKPGAAISGYRVSLPARHTPVAARTNLVDELHARVVFLWARKRRFSDGDQRYNERFALSRKSWPRTRLVVHQRGQRGQLLRERGQRHREGDSGRHAKRQRLQQKGLEHGQRAAAAGAAERTALRAPSALARHTTTPAREAAGRAAGFSTSFPPTTLLRACIFTVQQREGERANGRKEAKRIVPYVPSLCLIAPPFEGNLEIGSSVSAERCMRVSCVRCHHRSGALLRSACTSATAGLHPLPRVLVLAGPTGSGKSAVALRLASLLNGEIVSADSVAVYRGLDVGSAKPTRDERAAVPHHCLDLVPPGVEFSVGDWLEAAVAACESATSRRRTPLVVGGAGFYLRWLVSGRPSTPKSTEGGAAAAKAALRAAASAALAAAALPPDAPRDVVDALSWDAGCGALAAAGDSATAARLARNDWYRLERAFEVVSSTGLPLSCFLAGGEASTSPPLPPFDFRCFTLDPPRVPLYRRLDARCASMLCSGLLDEAAVLWAGGHRCASGSSDTDDDAERTGRSPPGAAPSPASRSIGYSEALRLLNDVAALQAARPDGCSDDEAGCALDAAVASFQRASRNYAKRQGTWFRGEKSYVRVAVGEDEDPLSVADRIAGAFLAQSPHAAAGGGEEESLGDGGGFEAVRAAKAAEKVRLKELAAYAPLRPALPPDQRRRLVAWLRGWAAQQAGQQQRHGALQTHE